LEERGRREREARVLAIQNRGDGENSERRSKRVLRAVSHQQIDEEGWLGRDRDI